MAKEECVFMLVIVAILPHTEFGPIDHRKDAPHFIIPSFLGYII